MNYEIATLNGHKDKVWCCAWNPQGTLIASCGVDKSIRVWGKVDDSWICKYVMHNAHNRTIRNVQWSPCGRYIASASFDGTINIWEQLDHIYECIATLEGHENEVKCVAWSSSGSLLATCSRDKTVWIWEVVEDEYDCVAVCSNHSQDVKKVAFHPHENIVASVSYDETIKFYSEDDGDWINTVTLKGHTSTIWGLSFNSDGTKLASCSDDLTVKIWQSFGPLSWKCVCTLSGYHKLAIYDIHWCPLSNLIATASADNSIKIFSESKDSSEESIYSLISDIPNAHSEDVNSISFNPKLPGILASAGDDMSIKIYNFSSFCDS